MLSCVSLLARKHVRDSLEITDTSIGTSEEYGTLCATLFDWPLGKSSMIVNESCLPLGDLSAYRRAVLGVGFLYGTLMDGVAEL